MLLLLLLLSVPLLLLQKCRMSQLNQESEIKPIEIKRSFDNIKFWHGITFNVHLIRFFSEFSDILSSYVSMIGFSGNKNPSFISGQSPNCCFTR